MDAFLGNVLGGTVREGFEFFVLCHGPSEPGIIASKGTETVRVAREVLDELGLKVIFNGGVDSEESMFEGYCLIFLPEFLKLSSPGGYEERDDMLRDVIKGDRLKFEVLCSNQGEIVFIVGGGISVKAFRAAEGVKQSAKGV